MGMGFSSTVVFVSLGQLEWSYLLGEFMFVFGGGGGFMWSCGDIFFAHHFSFIHGQLLG